MELGRAGGRKVLLADFDMDAGMVGFLMKVKSPYSILDAINNLHRLDASYWKALVSNGIPGLGDHRGARRLGVPAAAESRSNSAR